MPKTKLIVKTDVATFTRSTARSYTHIVVVKDVRHEVLEASRLATIAVSRKHAKAYRETIVTGSAKDDRTDWHRENTTKWIADGSYEKWANEYDATATEQDALGPITTDRETPWEVIGWCGRLDLARKLLAKQSANYDSASRYRHARIYDVATGQQVRW